MRVCYSMQLKSEEEEVVVCSEGESLRHNCQISA